MFFHASALRGSGATSSLDQLQVDEAALWGDLPGQ